MLTVPDPFSRFLRVGSGYARLDVVVLPFVGHRHGGAVQVVEERGVGKDVEKVLGTFCGTLSAGYEQSCLTLHRGECVLV